MITKHELSICAKLGVSASEYIITRRARALGQNLLSVNVQGAVVSGGRGHQVVSEAAERLRASGALPGYEDKTAGPGPLLAEAATACDRAYAAYLADPDSDPAWELAAEAGAFLEEALERFAPAYANRRAPSQAADDDDAESARAPGNPYGASFSRRVGAAIQRVAGPMLEAAGAPGLGSVSTPLRAAELAVCARLGIAPDDFAAASRRRVG